jgi:hypothetical protein
MTTLRTPTKLPYTGEGFRGEKWLSVAAIVLTVVSSVMLIHLTLLQREHVKMQMADLKKKNGEDTNKS